jgi:L-ascorbate metabolism protein UlaG (beta-lactamase superfamily)
MSLNFRWLGAAGIELKVGEQLLTIDPFFTRPSLVGLMRPVEPNAALIAAKIQRYTAVLVTHAHWDHLMDVPEVVVQTGAMVYGSHNTCQLLRLLGVPAIQVNEIHVGDTFTMGTFKIKVIQGQHSWIPFSHWFNGEIKPGLQPPLRLQDYRMDTCLGYSINVDDMHLLVCSAKPEPAGVLFAVAQETKAYYLDLLLGARPQIFIPIHWDNFTRPLGKSLKRFTRPGRMNLDKLTDLAGKLVPGVRVVIPEIFREYTL